MSDNDDLDESAFEGTYVDIEAAEPEEKPYDIDYSLSSYGIDFDITGLVRRFNNESIYLPPFQRNYVWNQNKASKFIESLLLGLPVPGIFLYKEEESQAMLIIDGYQRLESLRSFYKGIFRKKKFVLTEVVSALVGRSYDDLPENLQRKLDDTLLHATVIKADDPEEKNYDAVYLIFERLNTGGINLSPQEIRNCVSHGDLQSRLLELSTNATVKELLKIDSTRKKDQEVILRLAALTLGHKSYTGNMKQFLNAFMYKNRSFPDPKVIGLLDKTPEVSRFLLDANIEQVIRPNAQLSIAILDAVWVGTMKNFAKVSSQAHSEFRKKIETLLKDSEFEIAIRTGKTHHTDSVSKRIDAAIRIFEK